MNPSATVYVGFDSSNTGQKIAYEVCERSIRKYNSDINIVPLKLSELRGEGFTREHDINQSTEFTYTRFLAPYLNEYKVMLFFVILIFYGNVILGSATVY